MPAAQGVVTSFSGMGALPQIRQDLVVTHRAMTDEDLSRAVLFGRSSPGPVGLYIVSVGYAARGVPGAVVGWLALASPAFLAVPLLVAAAAMAAPVADAQRRGRRDHRQRHAADSVRRALLARDALHSYGGVGGRQVRLR